MTTQSLKDRYPTTLDLSEYTHKQRLALPWDVVEIEEGDSMKGAISHVGLVSGDRWYMAHFYMMEAVLGPAQLHVKLVRHLMSTTNRVEYMDPVAMISALPMSSYVRRLKALVSQYPQQRLSEAVHARTGLHSDFCTEACPLPAPKRGRPLFESMPKDWTEDDLYNMPLTGARTLGRADIDIEDDPRLQAFFAEERAAGRKVL